MSLSEELYLSILAMDSCNRGYDVGISIDDGFPAGATFLEQSNPSPESLEVQAGCYAIADVLGTDAAANLDPRTTAVSCHGRDEVDPLSTVRF